jgi:hypothetical protein
VSAFLHHFAGSQLQNNDRFYAMSRTLGLNGLLQLEQGSMVELVIRNSSAKQLTGDVFATPDFTFEMSTADPRGQPGPLQPRRAHRDGRYGRRHPDRRLR